LQLCHYFQLEFHNLQVTKELVTQVLSAKH
jgi:hypothetical protein